MAGVSLQKVKNSKPYHAFHSAHSMFKNLGQRHCNPSVSGIFVELKSSSV